jgi:hypothetical protein
MARDGSSNMITYQDRIIAVLKAQPRVFRDELLQLSGMTNARSFGVTLRRLVAQGYVVRSAETGPEGMENCYRLGVRAWPVRKPGEAIVHTGLRRGRGRPREDAPPPPVAVEATHVFVPYRVPVAMRQALQRIADRAVPGHSSFDEEGGG